MKMKQHILAALGEERDAWQVLVAGLSDEQRSAPLLPSEWTVKDVLAHLRAWQMRSIARLEAALLDREPEFPRWLAGVDPDGEGSPDQVNAWIYATYRDQPWSQVYAD